MDLPNVIIFGGCGFIGRNLVAYIVENNLAKNIRIVDKVPPQIAWLNQKHERYFNEKNVYFLSANLINRDSCEKAFFPLEGDFDKWHIAINCAGETKLGQTDPVYQEGIFKLSANCAQGAENHKVNHYVEISSGQMLSSEKLPMKEDFLVEPWTFISKWKHQVEQELANKKNLRYTILRPGIVYGVGDRHGFTIRLLIAAIYKYLNETMKLLWSRELRINTIHVEDLCRAIWFVANRDDTLGEIYNVVDDADSTQGTISDLLVDLFNIKIDFYGNLVSGVLDLANAADEGNDKHMSPWAEACQKDSIQNTPLSPHMDFELLLHKHLRLDGSKLKNMGFKPKHPKPKENLLKEILVDFVSMKIFPASLAP